MIYASDLDRTLIYSLGAIGVPETTPGLVPAEIIDGKTVSYISQQALDQSYFYASDYTNHTTVSAY